MDLLTAQNIINMTWESHQDTESFTSAILLHKHLLNISVFLVCAEHWTKGWEYRIEQGTCPQ